MRLGDIFRSAGPVLALAACASLAACDGMDVRVNGEEGVPLAQVDLSGAAPGEVVLVGPDRVVIQAGETFAIDVTGDDVARERMRFSLSDGSLAILRENADWSDNSIATVNITLPDLTSVTIAGSGEMTADRLTGEAEVTIAGSGRLETTAVDAQSLDVTIAGSGRYTAAGTTERLSMTVAGSGIADMAALQVGEADIDIAGSGDASFASDGEVTADIMGSGTVRVRGTATCTVESMGSGRLICEGSTADTAPAAPVTPSAPDAAEAPEAPETPEG